MSYSLEKADELWSASHGWLFWKRGCKCGWTQREIQGWWYAGANYDRHLQETRAEAWDNR